MRAIDEARKEQQAIENEISLLINNFHERTGLHIEDINLEHFETTTFASSEKTYLTRAHCVVRVHSKPYA